MDWVWFLVGVLTLTIVILIVKILDVHSALRQLEEMLTEHLNTDTNTLITLSSRDRTVRRLASVLNRELRTLRQLRWKYSNGNIQLRESITNLSHDLRTPLTAILGYLERLETQPHTEKSRYYLAVLQNRTNTMKQLIDELFSYSLLLGNEEKPKEAVHVNAVLEEAIAAFFPQLTLAGITPTINIPEARIIRNLNRNDLSRVFSNLISNAIKYSDGDLSIRMEENGTIYFTNHASGLDAVQVGLLFDRYYTLDAAHKSTGLGLAITKTLLEQMNGRIDAQYSEGQLLLIVHLPIH